MVSSLNTHSGTFWTVVPETSLGKKLFLVQHDCEPMQSHKVELIHTISTLVMCPNKFTLCPPHIDFRAAVVFQPHLLKENNDRFIKFGEVCLSLSDLFCSPHNSLTAKKNSLDPMRNYF